MSLQHLNSFLNKIQIVLNFLQAPNGVLSMVYSLLNDQNWFEVLWLGRDALKMHRFLLVWGLNYAFVGESYLEKFKLGFPKSKACTIKDCGHFPQEEEP